ncbi:unnamed protein product [Absidia cylindrospora]
MTVTSQYLDIHDQPALLSPFLSQIQKETHALASDQVASLTSYLLANLDTKPYKKEWDEQVITLALLTLKHLGRRVDDCDMLYKKQGIDILIKLTGLGVAPEHSLVDTSSSQAALKCLANCILLSSTSAPREDGGMIITWLVDSKNTMSTCARLLGSDSVSTDIQFLICRLLYLLTSDGTCIIDILMTLDLPGHIAKVLSRHVQQWLNDTSSTTEKKPSTILVNEVLKLQANMMLGLQEDTTTNTSDDTTTTTTTLKEDVSNRFSDSLIPILDIVFILPYPAPLPLVASAPLTHALQFFLLYHVNNIRQEWNNSPRLAVHCTTRLNSLGFCLNQLKTILENTLIYLMPPRPTSTQFLPQQQQQYTQPPSLTDSGWQPRQTSDSDLDRDMAIVLSLMGSTFSYAEEAEVSDLFHQYLVPRPETNDPAQALFFSRLVKLLSSPRFPHAKEMVTELLYSHVNEDPKAFIEMVGYENAKHTSIGKEYNVEDPSSSSSPPPPRTATATLSPQHDEEFMQLSDLTDEEKERQAERLFVMFEKIQLKE